MRTRGACNAQSVLLCACGWTLLWCMVWCMLYGVYLCAVCLFNDFEIEASCSKPDVTSKPPFWLIQG